MRFRIDRACERWIAAVKPIGDRLSQGWNAADRRITAKLAEMLL